MNEQLRRRRRVPRSACLWAAVMAMLLALMTTAGAPPASAADQPLWPTAGYLGRPGSSAVAEVENSSVASGTGVRLWPFHGGQNQRWQFLPRPSNRYTWQIMASHSRMCMDVEGGSRAPGARVRQTPCHNGSSQAWEPFVVRYDGWGQPLYRLVNDNSHLCLEAAAPLPEGASLHQAPCAAENAQEWSMTRPVSNPVSGRVMDVWYASTTSGVPVWLWDFVAGPHQEWYAHTLPDGHASQLVATHSRKCLDLEGGSTAAGATLVQQPCDTRRAGQRWVVEVTSWDIHRYAIYRIRNTTANRCLTAPTIGNGTRLVILDCNGTSSQEWRM
ncbi:RICIN domain-containing protein [Embleya sp. NPDC127516]|uniref:RICIN domain-containing protein n=1 Tax=Embleya sp. NPDC127516 TaxID=3363990 RepID=UPI003810119D